MRQGRIQNNVYAGNQFKLNLIIASIEFQWKSHRTHPNDKQNEIKTSKYKMNNTARDNAHGKFTRFGFVVFMFVVDFFFSFLNFIFRFVENARAEEIAFAHTNANSTHNVCVCLCTLVVVVVVDSFYCLSLLIT